jgi:hypothetical protein
VGVRDIEQYEPPDDGVECSVRFERRQIGFYESRVRHAVIFGTPPRGLHGRRGSVDTNSDPFSPTNLAAKNDTSPRRHWRPRQANRLKSPVRSNPISLAGLK